jgi:hypothetical protein
MKGLCVHSTNQKNLLQILESGYLKSTAEVPNNIRFSEDDDDKEYYINRLKNKIFLSLIFEDEEVSIVKKNTFKIQYYNLFFDPKIMEDYGKLKYTKKFEITTDVKPSVRCWFNKEWLHGVYDSESLIYDKRESLEDNIENFHNFIENSFNFSNEIVINDKEIKLSKYLLAIGIRTDNEISKNSYKMLKKKYPKIMFFNSEEMEEYIKLWV